MKVPCDECQAKIYAELRTRTLAQLRELVWHSVEAQEVLTEKIKESGMQEHERKWDAAMSVVKVGWVNANKFKSDLCHVNPAPDAAAPSVPSNVKFIEIK